MPIFLRIFIHSGRRNCGDVLTFDPNLAGSWLFEADKRAQEGAFTGTGAAKDDQSFAAINVECDAMKNFALAVIHAEIAHGDGGGGFEANL